MEENEIGPSSDYSKWNGLEVTSKSIDIVANDKKPLFDGDEKVYSFWEGTKAMILTGPLNILLVCLPFAMISYFADLNDGATFVLSLLALAPLAERLGFITEQLAIHTNDTIGGLLNATFGNATELIVAITALFRGLNRLVQLSLLGSILSNLLLVLGTAFFCGGLRYPTQKFGKISSQINATLLMLATMGVLFPAVLNLTAEDSNLADIGYSRFTAFLLILTYGAYLYFQLFTHKHAYDEMDYEEEHHHPPPTTRETSTKSPMAEEEAVSESENGTIEETKASEADDDDDEEEDILGFRNGIIWLAIITFFIAILSDALSSSIQDAANSANISAVFVAAIVLPIVGNAAEHAGAVMFAMKNKLDLTLGVAIGSSTQIALFVLPFLVIIGWMGGYDLSLNFGGYETATIFLTVITVTFAIKDGTSNWLIGLALLGGYFLIAAGFWAHNDEDLD